MATAARPSRGTPPAPPAAPEPPAWCERPRAYRWWRPGRPADAEDGLQQTGRRRLAVGPGDADHASWPVTDGRTGRPPAARRRGEPRRPRPGRTARARGRWQSSAVAPAATAAGAKSWPSKRCAGHTAVHRSRHHRICESRRELRDLDVRLDVARAIWRSGARRPARSAPASNASSRTARPQGFAGRDVVVVAAAGRCVGPVDAVVEASSMASSVPKSVSAAMSVAAPSARSAPWRPRPRPRPGRPKRPAPLRQSTPWSLASGSRRPPARWPPSPGEHPAPAAGAAAVRTGTPAARAGDGAEHRGGGHPPNSGVWSRTTMLVRCGCSAGTKPAKLEVYTPFMYPRAPGRAMRRGPGLARHGVPVDLGRLAGADPDHLTEHGGHLLGHARRDHPVFGRRRRGMGSAVGVDGGGHQLGRHVDAAVGDGVVGRQHLDRGHRDTLADGDASRWTSPTSCAGLGTRPADSPGKPTPVGWPNPNADRAAVRRCLPSRWAMVMVPDVGGVGQDVGHSPVLDTDGSRRRGTRRRTA